MIYNKCSYSGADIYLLLMVKFLTNLNPDYLVEINFQVHPVMLENIFCHFENPESSIELSDLPPNFSEIKRSARVVNICANFTFPISARHFVLCMPDRRWWLLAKPAAMLSLLCTNITSILFTAQDGFSLKIPISSLAIGNSSQMELRHKVRKKSGHLVITKTPMTHCMCPLRNTGVWVPSGKWRYPIYGPDL
jgi:hypothetical protein